jgi:hypothetical protein
MKRILLLTVREKIKLSKGFFVVILAGYSEKKRRVAELFTVLQHLQTHYIVLHLSAKPCSICIMIQNHEKFGVYKY